MAQPSYPQMDPREIAKWAKRYAQSRTIPFLVQWVFIVALVLIIGGLAYATIAAFHAAHTGMAWTCMGLLGAMAGVLLWLSVAQWGGEQIWRISQWLYGREGYAAYEGRDIGGKMKHARWVLAVGLGLALYHLAGAILVILGHLPMRFMQPFSALYMVPFLGIMIVSQRLGFWAWVWPAAYGLHSILLLMGRMPHFPGRLQFFDVVVPIFAYGLISILVGHCYSRYALMRLKALARAGLSDVNSEDTGEADSPAQRYDGE